MKLRNFLYLNTKVVEDYIAAIDAIHTMKNPKQFPPVKKTLYRVKGLSVSLREMVRT